MDPPTALANFNILSLSGLASATAHSRSSKTNCSKNIQNALWQGSNAIRHNSFMRHKRNPYDFQGTCGKGIADMSPPYICPNAIQMNEIVGFL